MKATRIKVSRTSFPEVLKVLFLGVPAVILLVCFAILCFRTQSLVPWPRVVHEDGKRTLLHTVFYFEHATRELPLDLLLGLASGGAVFYAFPPTARSDTAIGHRSAALRLSVLIGALALAAILIGTALAGGMPLILDNLFQNHTRPGTALLWGSHWRYHLLERSSLILMTLGFAGLLRASNAASRDRYGRRGLAVGFGSFVAFLALTFVFFLGPSYMMQTFRDPQYLGHQIRELMTHATVTVPLAWGACLAAMPAADIRLSVLPPPLRRLRSPTRQGLCAAAGVIGVLLAALLTVLSLVSDARSHGQSQDLITLIVPHYFEHSLGYVLTASVAVLVYGLSARCALYDGQKRSTRLSVLPT